MRVVAENYEQTHTHTHTNTRDNYSNPRCAHARRGLINTCRRQESLRMMLKHNSQLNCSYSYPSKPRLVVTVVRLYIYGFSKWLLTQISHIHTATACVSPHVHSTHGCPTSKFVGANVAHLILILMQSQNIIVQLLLFNTMKGKFFQVFCYPCKYTFVLVSFPG